MRDAEMEIPEGCAYGRHLIWHDGRQKERNGKNEAMTVHMIRPPLASADMHVVGVVVSPRRPDCHLEPQAMTGVVQTLEQENC